ncbi:hypothetical protein AOE01nite_14460 [Acetobacter oeni]|uniref:Uncharacterized protein n=1 Tax=Acetobacter oeni TaxID=304077 RepID=A0A511XJV7_9PROT|nr:hypothetical protein [Acetobacter oeni]GBR04029.1 hypothetical protein AA21952_1271 [Acetobacter oeni LMG 21952]GEN63222.1 hypothetical protein AOE01nite_14460 [Acetobacter oeni]
MQVEKKSDVLPDHMALSKAVRSTDAKMQQRLIDLQQMFFSRIDPDPGVV